MKVKGFGRREFFEVDVMSVLYQIYLWVIAMIADILNGCRQFKNNVFFNQSQFLRQNKREFFEGRDE